MGDFVVADVGVGPYLQCAIDCSLDYLIVLICFLLCFALLIQSRQPIHTEYDLIVAMSFDVLICFKISVYYQFSICFFFFWLCFAHIEERNTFSQRQ